MRYYIFMNTFEKILIDLNDCKEDQKFIDFVTPIANTKTKIIGVKTPNLKKIANKYSDIEIDGFIRNYSYETNFIYVTNFLKKAKNIDECFILLTTNIDLIDTWALTDSTFKMIKTSHDFNKDEISIEKFLCSKEEFIIRYGFLLLFEYGKDPSLSEVVLNKIFDSKYFYVMMVEARLISIVAVYNFEAAYKYLKESNIDLKIKLKAISKCRDSFRINEDQKTKLKNLREKLKGNF